MSKLPTLFQKKTLVSRMGEKQKDLDEKVAIEYIMSWFNDRIPIKYKGEAKIKTVTISDRVIILKSGTGSGKSTSLPPNLYLRFQKRLNKQIIVTQPRVLTAIEIPKTIASIPAYKKVNKDGLQIELYKNLGYQTKEFIRKPLDKGMLFTTVGILLQFLKNMTDEQIINKYAFILIDEVHDRTLDIDLVLNLLKSLLMRNLNKDCPFIILMSATLNVELFANYFGTKTIFEVTGKSYNIDTHFQEYDVQKYIECTVNIVKDIHINNKSDYLIDNKIEYNTNSDILIFVSGMSMMLKISKELEKLNNEFEYPIIIINLTSDKFKLAGNDYKNIYKALNSIKLNIKEKNINPVRRVIISTNIAETGVTIESLKYCIDTGFVTSIEYNPNLNCKLLSNKAVTKSMVIQRKGRVGRVQSGIWYGLYTKDIFNKLQEDSFPNIYVEEFTLSLLSILNKIINDSINNKKDYLENEIDIESLHQIDLTKLDLISQPSIDTLSNSINKLYILGAIYSNYYITPLGYLFLKLRKLDIECMKMLLTSFIYDDINHLDIVTIAAYLTLGKKNIVDNKFKSWNISFINKNDKCIDYYNYNKLKNRLYISCEFIEFLLVFKQFIQIVKENKLDVAKEWCKQNKILYNGIMSLIQLRDDIIKELIFNCGLNPLKNSSIDLLEMLEIDYKIKKKGGGIYKDKLDNSIKYISKIKHCIYEGYKLNIAKLNEDNEYESLNEHIIVNIKSGLVNNLPTMQEGKEFKQTKPKYIIYSNIMMIFNNNTNIYEFNTGDAISIMDGFVNIDETFCIS